MSLGAAHPLPNWRKNISYWKYDSVWKGKKVYEKQEAENITCGLIEMIRCFKGPELLGGGGSLHLKSCCFFLLQEDTDQGELY